MGIIKRGLAGRKRLPYREWQVVQNIKQQKLRFYSSELRANSLVVMNTALLHPCHIFMQLSYNLAMLLTQPMKLFLKQTDQLSSRKVYSLFIRYIHQPPITNVHPFLFAIWTLFLICELIQKENDNKSYIVTLSIV